MMWIRAFISLHRHRVMMVTYCCITGMCVWLSAKNHPTFLLWISQSDWSAFLLWHFQFHVWYVFYHALNFAFLGRLRSFERMKARKGQLSHLMNTVIFILLVCGLDLFEGFWWLHWITPFSFFRMSLIVIYERLENPPPPVIGTPVIGTVASTVCRHPSQSVHPEVEAFQTAQNAKGASFRRNSQDPQSFRVVASSGQEGEQRKSSFDHDPCDPRVSDDPPTEVQPTTPLTVIDEKDSRVLILGNGNDESDSRQNLQLEKKELNENNERQGNSNNKQSMTDDSRKRSVSDAVSGRSPDSTPQVHRISSLSLQGDDVEPLSVRSRFSDCVFDGNYSPATVFPPPTLEAHHRVSRMTNDPYDAKNNEILILYLLILLAVLFLWCLCGSLVFHSLPFASKLMVLYEPVVCCLQWVVVFSCVSICDSSLPMGSTRDGLKFGIKWAGEFICQLLAVFRYAIVWLLFGHATIFNLVDVLIFMKLKGCFSGLAVSIHNLRVFLTVRHILNKKLPTVHPKPNGAEESSLQQQRHDELLDLSPLIVDDRDEGIRASHQCCCSEHHHELASCFASSGFDEVVDFATDQQVPRRRNRTVECEEECSRSVAPPPALSGPSPGDGLPSAMHKLRCLRSLWTVLRFCYHTGRVACCCLLSKVSSSQSFLSSSSFTSSSTDEQHVSPHLSFHGVYPICVVCREPMCVAKQLPCSHILHHHCLRQWLRTDVTCPICRCPALSPSDEELLKTVLGRFPRHRDPTFPTRA